MIHPGPGKAPSLEPQDAALRKLEREQAAQFEFQWRYNLLRIIVPTLFIVILLSIPGALESDIAGPNGWRGLFALNSSTAQVVVVLAGTSISLWAFRRKRVILSSYALFFGVSAIITMLLLNDTVFSNGKLSLGSIPEFALLLVPIVLASVLGGPILIVLTALATTSLTVALLTWMPPDAALLAYRQANSGGFVLYTVPISLQLVIGALVYATLAGLRRAQVQLNTVRAAYERERELDALKNQFIASINHELRTPLMAMQGYMVLAREFGKANETEQQDHMLDLGLESMQHVNGLVDSILEVRRIETDVTALELVPVDLHNIILKATTLIDPRVAGQGEREIRLRVPGLLVLADEARLRQVLVNLISNACKYSAPNDPIDISARLMPAGQADRRKDMSSQVEITVRDYGQGIPPEQIPLLFQRFVRLQRDIASNIIGAGLGLAISRAYVEAMGGRIWVESTGVPGEGSAFSFTLQLAEAKG